MNVGLSDHELSSIGITTVLEAHAKTHAALALKAMEKLTQEQWFDLMKNTPFKTISQRLINSACYLNDKAKSLCIELHRVRDAEHNRRHVVVHSIWSSVSPASGYDLMTGQQLTMNDIALAVEGAARLRAAAFNVVFYVAELISIGILDEGDGLVQMNVGGGRLVRF